MDLERHSYLNDSYRPHFTHHSSSRQRAMRPNPECRSWSDPEQVPKPGIYATIQIAIARSFLNAPYCFARYKLRVGIFVLF